MLGWNVGDGCRGFRLCLDVGRSPVSVGRDGDTLDLFDILAFHVHHDAAQAGDDAAQGDESARGPRRAHVPVVVVHVEAEDDLEEGVPHIHPNDKVHLPALGGRRAMGRRRRGGYLFAGDGHGRIVGVDIRCACGGGQLFGARQTEPASVYAS